MKSKIFREKVKELIKKKKTLICIRETINEIPRTSKLDRISLRNKILKELSIIDNFDENKLKDYTNLLLNNEEARRNMIRVCKKQVRELDRAINKVYRNLVLYL
jgi:hypothetical protein